MRLLLLWALVIIGSLAGASQHQALANASTYIANGNTAQVDGPTDTGGTYCRQVTNNSGQTIFVPANIPLEWSDFYTNPEPGVSITDCPPANCPAGSVGRMVAADLPLQYNGYGPISNGNTVNVYFSSGSHSLGGGATEYWTYSNVQVTCYSGTNMITGMQQAMLNPTPGNPSYGVFITNDGQQIIITPSNYTYYQLIQ